MTELAVMLKYESYKDSGVEWLASLPNTWTTKRIKFLLDEVNDRSTTGEEELLSLSKYKGVIKKNSLEEKSGGAASLVGYKRVYNNHLVINKMQAVNGLLSVSNIEGITSPDYSVYKTKNNNLININYLNYLLLQPGYLAEFKRRVTGVMEGFIRLYTDDLFDIKAILPPIETQQRIVCFLDTKTVQIDEIISIKEKQIELLKERKKVIIQKNVTQGINPDVPKVDSGVDWIGEIPEHWQVKRAKYLFDEIDERSDNGDEELLSVSHITGVTPRSEKSVTMVAEDYSGSKTCQKNDFVMNIMWAWMGAMGVSDRPGIVSSAYSIFRQTPLGIFNPTYLEWLMKSVGYIEHYNKVSTGLHSSRLRFYSRMFFNMEIGYPSRQEQDEIVSHIEKQSFKIDDAVELQKQQIQKLKEYKTTLINSAVTGKIKVS